MPRKTNKQLQEENAALRAQVIQLSARKASDDDINDNNSVTSSQSSSNSRDSQHSVVTGAFTKLYAPPGIVSGGAAKSTMSPPPTDRKNIM